MPALKDHYNCKFCTSCELPMKIFVRCNECIQDFHQRCYTSLAHNCVTCKYCQNDQCLKTMEQLKNRKIKILKNIDRIPPSYNIIKYKQQNITLENILKTLVFNEENKFDKMKRLLNDVKIHCFRLKNNDYLSEMITAYTSLYTVTYFMDQLFYVNRCKVCLLGFHASDKEIELCDNCRRCFNCNVINILPEKYSVVEVNTYNKNNVLTRNYIYCKECYEIYYMKNEMCPICNKSYTQENMVECEWCLRWVHYSCEPNKKLLNNIKKEIHKSWYKCPICEVYEGYWTNKTSENVYLNTEKYENDKSHLEIYNIDTIKIKYPICFLCKKEYSYIESEIIRLVPVKSKDTVLYAHNICVASCSYKDNNSLIVENKNRQCRYCRKMQATLKCLYCKDDYFHFNCSFQVHNDLFRSNILLPICTKHYCKNLEKIPKAIKLYQMHSYFIKQDFKPIYFQISDMLIFEDGCFETLIYGSTISFLLKCDFKHFYLNEQKMTANDITYKLKEHNYNIKLENIINEALDLHKEKFPEYKWRSKLCNYNTCIDKKFQVMNFSLSYISHIIHENKLTIKNSKIHGKGVFATRFYFPNEVIINYTGETISKEEANRREKNEYKNLDCYLFKTNDNVIDATYMGNISKFINQSCVPNCYSTEATWGDNTGILICAKTFISLDEELTYKYGFADKKMLCKCGSLNCKSNNILKNI